MGNDEQIARLTRRAEEAETRLAEAEAELIAMTKLYKEAVRHIEAIYNIISLDILEDTAPQKGGCVSTQPHVNH
jgi:hypothetical protein